MGKPYVPYTAKRIIEACLEHNWDFELARGPVTLFLHASSPEHGLTCEFRMTPAADSMGRPTIRYETITVAMSSENSSQRTVGMNIDAACMFIETHTVKPVGH